MDFLPCFLKDSAMLPIVQLCFLLFVGYAIIFGERKMKRDRMAGVIRGQKSWDYFNLAYGIVSVIVVQLITVSDYGHGYKVFLSIFNLSVLFYISFFNGWFRNKIIGLVVLSRNKEE